MGIAHDRHVIVLSRYITTVPETRSVDLYNHMRESTLNYCVVFYIHSVSTTTIIYNRPIIFIMVPDLATCITFLLGQRLPT